MRGGGEWVGKKIYNNLSVRRGPEKKGEILDSNNLSEKRMG